MASIMHSPSAALDGGSGRVGAAVRGAGWGSSSNRAGPPPGAGGGGRWPVSRDAHPRLHAFGVLFLGAVPLAGVLSAALLLPWVVGPGLMARSSANLLAPLPGVLSNET